MEGPGVAPGDAVEAGAGVGGNRTTGGKYSQVLEGVAGVLGGRGGAGVEGDGGGEDDLDRDREVDQQRLGTLPRDSFLPLSMCVVDLMHQLRLTD